MTGALQVRSADWRDLAAMTGLERRCFPVDAWTEATFWAELARRPDRSYWVATQACGGRQGEPGGDGAPAQEQVVGYAGLSSDGEVADVMTLAVDPAVRGRGCGSRLLDRLHEVARSSGAGSMMLEARADNVPALGLYAAAGYRQVHVRRGYYRSSDGGPAVDALVLRKELTTP